MRNFFSLPDILAFPEFFCPKTMNRIPFFVSRSLICGDQVLLLSHPCRAKTLSLIPFFYFFGSSWGLSFNKKVPLCIVETIPKPVFFLFPSKG